MLLFTRVCSKSERAISLDKRFPRSGMFETWHITRLCEGLGAATYQALIRTFGEHAMCGADPRRTSAVSSKKSTRPLNSY
jgi:hypothetical protein